MKTSLLSVLLLAAGVLSLRAESALTIYNQDFAVVRDTVPLDLKAGVNDIHFNGVTASLEPDSVILRDPRGKYPLHVLEQNYRNDPLSQELLLSLFEGKAIDFLVKESGKPDRVVQGKIVRSGYQPPAYGGSRQPIVEVDGKIQFGLPGQPIFPSLGDDTILKPRLDWKLNTAQGGKLDAELAYVTGGLNWEADYNLVAPEQGDALTLVGWITMNNQSGKTFENAKIKLMAGDVSKVIDQNQNRAQVFAMAVRSSASAPAVTEKTFDEYHLYTLPRPTTLRDQEVKQIEFVHADGVASRRIYVYDGLNFDAARWGSPGSVGDNPDFGTESNTKVAVFREFKNSEANHLGLPLPKGKIRFYRQDGHALEFIGENIIDHTPKDETVKAYTGNAFDLVGKRTRTAFKVDQANHWADESFEIKLRNHKAEPVEIRVVEHLYRWTNWEIAEPSIPFTKSNAREIKFMVSLKPDEEKTVTYRVHYTW